MANVATGRMAETAVADCLAERGYKILGLNWKTKLCEIDVIAKKDKIVYFVEVKYRAGGEHGSGFEYLTNNKIQQMQFAGRIWNQNNNWDGDWHMLAAEVSGLNFENINITEID